MNEKTPEDQVGREREEQDFGVEEQLAYWLTTHPHITAPVETKVLRESGPAVAELEAMMTSFEVTYPLEALHAITELTPEDAPNHPLRAPAVEALKPILEKLQTLARETDISKEAHDLLKAKYRILSQAVGIINKGKVDHTR